MMWYGVLGTKEVLHRTYKNLEQRVLLEVRHAADCFLHCIATDVTVTSLTRSLI